MSVYSLAIVVLAAVVAAVAYGLWRRRRKAAEAQEHAESRKQEEQDRVADLPAVPLTDREEDAVYQWSRFHGERLVARVVDAEIDEDNKEILFRELYQSDFLLLPDECEFRGYKILVRTVGDAVKVDKLAPEKGRILRDVKADILGYLSH